MVPRTIYHNHGISPFSVVDSDFSVFGIIEFPTKVGCRFLLVRTERGKLKLPGGKKRGFELPYETLIREVREETGILIDADHIDDECAYFNSAPSHDFFVFRVVLPKAPRFPHRGCTGETPRVMSLEDIKSNFLHILLWHRYAIIRYLSFHH